MYKVMFFLFLSLVCPVANSYEKLKLDFSHSAKSNKNIEVNFYGYEFEDKIPILGRPIEQDLVGDVSEIVNFLKQLHRVNLNGSAEEIMELWHPEFRDEVAEGLSEDELELNQSRFKLMQEMWLRLIVNYDGVLICYVVNDFGDKGKWEMEFTISKLDGNYYLTKELNDDYFFQTLATPLFKNTSQ